MVVKIPKIFATTLAITSHFYAGFLKSTVIRFPVKLTMADFRLM